MRILAKEKGYKTLILIEVLEVEYDAEENELLCWTDDSIINYIVSGVTPEFWKNAAHEALRNGYLDLSEYEIAANQR